MSTAAQDEMKLASFKPGIFIELDNPLGGNRYLVLVCGKGNEFIDYIDALTPATPLPIFAAMNPVQVGDFTSYKYQVMETRPKDRHTFSKFIDDILHQLPYFDNLNFHRAIKWGFDSRIYDAKQAIQAALAERREVMRQRKWLQKQALDAITANPNLMTDLPL